MEFKNTYRSNDNLIDDFFIPAISQSKNLKFCTAYFSTKTLIIFYDQISTLILNGGTFDLIIGIETQEQEIQYLIHLSMDKEAELIYDTLFSNFSEDEFEILKFYKNQINLGNFKIKVGDTKNNQGIFHNKLYVFEPQNTINRAIAAHGSLNFTVSGLHNNYETLILRESYASFLESKFEFNALWQNALDGTEVIDIKNILIGKLDNKLKSITPKSAVRLKNIEKLRDYQHEAIQIARNNNYSGILKMATGTGKTYTALGMVNDYLFNEKRGNLVIIVVPYQHLADQWKEEISDFFADELMVRVIYAGSNNGDANVNDILNRQFFKRCLIFVDKSFYKSCELIDYQNYKPLFIMDEVHNANINFLKEHKSTHNLEHKIGLSATPEDEFDDEKTSQLFDYFCDIIYTFDLSEAINLGYLTNYYYYPKKVELEYDEAIEYDRLIYLLSINEDRLKVIRELEDLLSTAHKKMLEFKSDFKELFFNENDIRHTIVYCSQGSDKKNSNKKYIELVSIMLNEISSTLNVAKFTADETAKQRKEITQNFINEKTDVLLAIKCLDEGYNVPAIKHAYILNSGIREREFIQRRGRLLRQYEGKKFAVITDYLIYKNGKILDSELKRYKIYSSLALNKVDLEGVINE